MSGVLIVGGGPAAHRLAERLVRHGHGGGITVVGAEPRAPYHRALLGSVLDGSLESERLALPALPGPVRLLTGVRVTGVDRALRTVRTADGRELPYDTLVLATGARARVPAVPGLTDRHGRLAEGVRLLRAAADCRPLSEGPVVVVGGGTRGVEAALALRRAGHEVVLAHPAAHPMDRHLDAAGGAVVAQWLAERGVTLRLGRRAAEYAPGKVVLDDGEVLAAGTVLVCAGTVPETRLARAAGLPVGEGVLVDARLRTADPHVHAIGDCAEQDGTPGATVLGAWEQADTLARILTGEDTVHRAGRHALRPRLPGRDLVVLPPGRDGAEGDRTVTLRDPARGRYARLVLREGRIRHGVVAGSARAVAAVTLLHARDAPVPADLLALLTGADGTYTGGGEPPEDTVVCHCNNVTRKTLKDAWHGGARDAAALAAATRATTGCGSCGPVVRELCAALGRPADPAEGGTR